MKECEVYELNILVDKYKAGEFVDEYKMVMEARRLGGFIMYKYYYNLIPYVLYESDTDSFIDFAFAKALYAYKSGPTKFSSFYSTVLKNEIFMIKRKYDRRITYVSNRNEVWSLDHDIYENNADTFEAITPDPTWEDILNSAELRIVMEGFLNKLTPKEKSILTKVQKGLSQHEIARQMGLSQPYVSRIIKRLRQEVKAQLA